MIDFCLSNLINCSLEGVIGYEMSSRVNVHLNNVNAEPIILFRKGDKSIVWNDLVVQKSFEF